MVVTATIEAARVPVERFRVIKFRGGEEMIAKGDFERDADGDGMPD